jgi:hypothetical protein
MARADPIHSSLSPAQLGGPGALDAPTCAAHAMTMMAEAAGADMRLSSLSLDVTSHALGDGPIDVTVQVDRRTRSIDAKTIEARSGGRLVYSAQALFSRAG